ncbi:MAG: nicotinamide riboside transporter PnuC [Bacteroidota bacterium]
MDTWGAIEWIGAISGIAGVWLTDRHTSWCYPVGLVNVGLSAILFYYQKLYADSLQQVVYMALLVYGWLCWAGFFKKVDSSHISTSPFQEQITITFCMVAGGACLGWLLQGNTDASLPWADSFATSAAFSAQFLIARKRIENWLWWIPVNLGYMWIYWTKGLEAYVLLSGVYLILAIHGFFQWRSILRASTQRP